MIGGGFLWRGVALGLALAVCGHGVALAQTQGGPANVVPTQATAGEAPQVEALDYEAWNRQAARAEEAIAARDVSPLLLEQTRAQIADWRSAFLAAQGANATRIATLRGQLTALGAAPAEGETEAEEIATRRRELTEQLVRQQAPVIAADEAYSRADGLIREIDRTLRERQAEELLRLSPAPVNPANWPDAFGAVQRVIEELWQETAANWNDAEARRQLLGNLPPIIALLAFAVALLWRGRKWFERLPNQLRERASARGRDIWAMLASLGQIVVPVAGVMALTLALGLTAMPGPQGGVIIAALTSVSFTAFAARWLGLRLFPKGPAGDGMLQLAPERRAEGRFAATGLGLLLALETLRGVIFDPLRTSDAANAVLAFPILLLSAMLLFRIGQLLRRHVVEDTAQGEGVSYRNRLIGLLGRGAMVVAAIGPALGAAGYVAAGAGMVYPAVVSLALVGVLFTLQKLVGDVFALFSRSEDGSRDALAPVLIGFLLTLATLPVFALIWGARWADITEVLTRFREGFQLGQTRISPTDFLYFIVLFGFGFMLTRLFQGALKSTILPKTTLDQGGQNAVVAGVGYVGIFLAGVLAINGAGIDLSGLAIVAGALSVGIGFGLQNIVSNFVSGIILLIERPVSEGDWIEVGGVQGRVRAISVRSTRIETFDRTDVIVPNTDLIAGQVTNWTRFNLTGRLILKVGVAYGSDTRRVAEILREVAEAQPLAVLNPPPAILFMGFGADSLDFEIRMILRDVNFGLSVRSEVNHEIARRFAEEGIEIPFAQRDIWLRNPEALTGPRASGAEGPKADPVPPPKGPPSPDLWPEPTAEAAADSAEPDKDISA